MDGNDLYQAVVAEERDPNSAVRAALAEISESITMLSEEEQGFVAGVQANLDLYAPITQQNRATLGRILQNLRNKRHSAVGPR